MASLAVDTEGSVPRGSDSGPTGLTDEQEKRLRRKVESILSPNLDQARLERNEKLARIDEDDEEERQRILDNYDSERKTLTRLAQEMFKEEVEQELRRMHAGGSGSPHTEGVLTTPTSQSALYEEIQRERTRSGGTSDHPPVDLPTSRSKPPVSRYFNASISPSDIGSSSNVNVNSNGQSRPQSIGRAAGKSLYSSAAPSPVPNHRNGVYSLAQPPGDDDLDDLPETFVGSPPSHHSVSRRQSASSLSGSIRSNHYRHPPYPVAEAAGPSRTATYPQQASPAPSLRRNSGASNYKSGITATAPPSTRVPVPTSSWLHGATSNPPPWYADWVEESSPSPVSPPGNTDREQSDYQFSNSPRSRPEYQLQDGQRIPGVRHPSFGSETGVRRPESRISPRSIPIPSGTPPDSYRPQQSNVRRLDSEERGVPIPGQSRVHVAPYGSPEHIRPPSTSLGSHRPIPPQRSFTATTEEYCPQNSPGSTRAVFPSGSPVYVKRQDSTGSVRSARSGRSISKPRPDMYSYPDYSNGYAPAQLSELPGSPSERFTDIFDEKDADFNVESLWVKAMEEDRRREEAMQMEKAKAEEARRRAEELKARERELEKMEEDIRKREEELARREVLRKREEELRQKEKELRQREEAQRLEEEERARKRAEEQAAERRAWEQAERERLERVRREEEERERIRREEEEEARIRQQEEERERAKREGEEKEKERREEEERERIRMEEEEKERVRKEREDKAKERKQRKQMERERKERERREREEAEQAERERQKQERAKREQEERDNQQRLQREREENERRERRRKEAREKEEREAKEREEREVREREEREARERAREAQEREAREKREQEERDRLAAEELLSQELEAAKAQSISPENDWTPAEEAIFNKLEEDEKQKKAKQEEEDRLLAQQIQREEQERAEAERRTKEELEARRRDNVTSRQEYAHKMHHEAARKRQDSTGNISDPRRSPVTPSSTSSSSQTATPWNIPRSSASAPYTSPDRTSSGSSFSNTSGASFWSQNTGATGTSYSSTASAGFASSPKPASSTSAWTRAPHTASSSHAAHTHTTATHTTSTPHASSTPHTTSTPQPAPTNFPSPGSEQGPYLDQETWQYLQDAEAARQAERFQRELKQQEKERQAMESRALTKDDIVRLFDEHDRRWKQLPQAGIIGWGSIPWPSLKQVRGVDDLTPTTINAYIRNDNWPSDKTLKERVREQIRRWHPDRFDTGVLSKVREVDKERVKIGAGIVARTLNDILKTIVSS